MKTPIPRVLYKYYPIEDWLPKLINGESILFSSRRTFNVPMDSCPGYRLDIEDPIGLARVKLRLREKGLTAAQRVMELSRLRRRHAGPISFDAIDPDSMLDNAGILCLSDQWDNMLLWAHYAKMHRGVCIGFKTDLDFFQQAMPVIYADDQPIVERTKDDDDTLVRKVFFTKPSCWKYENEWRIVKRYHDFKGAPAARDKNFDVAADERGAGFYQFDAGAIESVTLGMHSSAEHT